MPRLGAGADSIGARVKLKRCMHMRLSTDAVQDVAAKTARRQACKGRPASQRPCMPYAGVQAMASSA